MPHIRLGRTTYTVFTVLVVVALSIEIFALLKLQRPEVADARPVALYSRNEVHKSPTLGDQSVHQASTQDLEIAHPAKEEARNYSETSSKVTRDSGSFDSVIDGPKRSIAWQAGTGAKTGTSREKLTMIPGNSPKTFPKKLPTWTARIDAPIFYRSSVETPPALPGGERETAGGATKPVCRNMLQTSGNSRVIFPLPEDYMYSYEDSWGAARVQGAHEGTDIMAPEGTPEYAITDGTLVPVAGSNGNGWNTLGGYAVMLRADHSMGPIKAGDLFYYAHMREESALPIGTHVRAGQVLGFVGDTGQGPEVTRGLFPPHLHFGWYDTTGLRTNLPSGAMNPYPLLEWLKANGGTISGGSSARYCEAPQSKEPIPSTGRGGWPSPSSPGKMPDLDTGTGNAKPSPVAARTTSPSGNASGHAQTTRRNNVREFVKHRIVEKERSNRPEARKPSEPPRRAAAPRESEHAVERPDHRVQKARHWLPQHSTVHSILRGVEERIGRFDGDRIKSGIRDRVGGWIQPDNPTKPHGNDETSSASKQKRDGDHAITGKDDPATPAPVDGSSQPVREPSCDAANENPCSTAKTEKTSVTTPDDMESETSAEPETTAVAEETEPDPEETNDSVSTSSKSKSTDSSEDPALESTLDSQDE